MTLDHLISVRFREGLIMKISPEELEKIKAYQRRIERVAHYYDLEIYGFTENQGFGAHVKPNGSLVNIPSDFLKILEDRMESNPLYNG